jgi:hypothetical protein
VSDLVLVAKLFSPLFLGLVLHGFCIRFGWLRALAVPIDAGVRLRGRPLFGANKTWRGVVAVGLGAAAGYVLQGADPALQPAPLRACTAVGLAGFGLAIGAAAMLSELPNSLIKRQLEIAPGRPARGPAGPLFYVLDQVDLLAGAWLVAGPLVRPALARVLWSVLFVVVLHQVVSALGFLLGMRAAAR